VLSKIISGVVLYTAVIVGAAPAAGQNGSDADLRQCVNRLRGSIWESGGDEEDAGYSAFDNLVWHCQGEIYPRHASQPQRPPPRTARRRR